MKVSFDFDGTLTKSTVQEYAKELVGKGIDVYIVTSRYKYFNKIDGLSVDNSDLWRLVGTIGIESKNVIFTEMEWKAEFFKKHKDFLFHLDDYTPELTRIMTTKGPKPISLNGNWKQKCNAIIEKTKTNSK